MYVNACIIRELVSSPQICCTIIQPVWEFNEMGLIVSYVFSFLEKNRKRYLMSLLRLNCWQMRQREHLLLNTGDSCIIHGFV